MTKTLKMAVLEQQDEAARRQPRRDIRDIIQEAVDEAGDLTGAAELLGIGPSTLSGWIHRHLGGELRGRVVFPDFQARREATAARARLRFPARR